MTSTIHIKTIPGSMAAAHRRSTSRVDVFENIPAGMKAVLDVLSAAGVEPAGPPTTVFHRIPGDDADGDISVRVPIAAAIEPVDGVETVTVSEQIVAAAVHEGSYETLGDTHATIVDWIEQHGHEVVGAATETYFNSPLEVPPGDLRTEVAFEIDLHQSQG